MKTQTTSRRTPALVSNQSPVIDLLQDRSQTASISAFFIHDTPPSKELNDALELVNPKKWSLMRLTIDDPIAEAFRVVKLPTLILHNGDGESARVFGDQHIVEMIGRAFDE
jgi:hypothetical protein